MEQATLEDRVADLEKTVTKIIAGSYRSDVKKNWRDTVGFFKDDPIAKVSAEEGRKMREADRQQGESLCY